MTPPKITNPTVMAFNESKLDEISDKEFKRLGINMLKEIKEDTNS